MSWVNNPVNPYVPTNGAYTGNDGVDRGIAHGLVSTPRFVWIAEYNTNLFFFLRSGGTAILCSNGNSYTVAAMDITNFYVGDAASYANTANANTVAYKWVAFP